METMRQRLRIVAESIVKATDCMYNEQCKCEAGKVSVEGSCACHKDGTECATFQCR